VALWICTTVDSVLIDRTYFTMHYPGQVILIWSPNIYPIEKIDLKRFILSTWTIGRPSKLEACWTSQRALSGRSAGAQRALSGRSAGAQRALSGRSAGAQRALSGRSAGTQRALSGAFKSASFDLELNALPTELSYFSST